MFLVHESMYPRAQSRFDCVCFVQDFNCSVSDISSQEVMEMMLITQCFDMLKDVGGSKRSATVFMPHQPGGISDMCAQIRSGILEAQTGTDATAQHMRQ
jgi:hypothetical protein